MREKKATSPSEGPEEKRDEVIIILILRYILVCAGNAGPASEANDRDGRSGMPRVLLFFSLLVLLLFLSPSGARREAYPSRELY